MTTTKEREGMAKLAMLVAEEAAALVLGGYRTNPRADRKGQKDLVTEFDRASEELLTSRLHSLTPGVLVVGEETTRAGDDKAREGLAWYVDPIDGTTNFVHGHPFWCVSVGLFEDDEPIAGAVVAPAIQTKWIGWTSSSDGEEGFSMRNGARCRVSDVATLEAALVATGFPPNRDVAPDNNFDSFFHVKRAAQAVRRCGAAAIDMCFVADGTYDAYWERRLCAWDSAAASAILASAKGRLTALDGSKPNQHVGHLLASNGLVHEEMLRVLAPTLKTERGSL